MRRAYSVANVTDAKFKTYEFKGQWREAVGCPEKGCTWIILGPPKNGKTSTAMMATKYLAGFTRCAYDSIEEGLSLTIKKAMERVGMSDVASKVILLDKESPEELKERLSKHKSPDVIIFDSIQFGELDFKTYKELKWSFPNKTFIYVSHVDGKNPEGSVAKRIYKDAAIILRVEGFKIFPTSRYGGGAPIVINEELADAYWGLKV